jgi:hypothetical protein
MARIGRTTLAMTLMSLTAACAYVRRAQDRRLIEWQETGITVAEAREILGTAPYAIPGLELVAIHADRRSRVITVTQRVEPGVLVSLSQHRGRYIPPTSRPFWVVERYHLERVPYTTQTPSPDRYFVYVPNGATASAEQRIRDRRFTRWVEEGLTIRIWTGWVDDVRRGTMLAEAQPIAN